MPMDLSQIQEAVARGWGVPPNTSKTMDPDLALGIAQEVHKSFLADKTPNLGCATTNELIEEIKARIGDRDLEYRTVETDDEREKRLQLSNKKTEPQPQGG